MKIASREYVVKKMTELMIFPKKKYSQNFLVNPEIVEKSVEALDLTSEDTIIEIGPGLGALTQGLVETGNKVISYEIDKDLIEYLKSTFRNHSNFSVINEDIVKARIDTEIASLKIISNLPYNLTTPIIEKVLTTPVNLKCFEFMLQKEAGQRLKAGINTRDYSPLTVLIEYLGNLKIISNVSRNNYLPVPNVDSQIMLFEITRIRDFGFEKKLYFLLKNCFKMRRKTIANNLIGIFQTKEKVSEVLQKVGLSPLLRPEQIKLEEYILLAKEVA